MRPHFFFYAEITSKNVLRLIAGKICCRLPDSQHLPSIFHRSGRIHEFRLSQNLATRQFGQAPQSNSGTPVGQGCERYRCASPCAALTCCFQLVSQFALRKLSKVATTIAATSFANYRCDLHTCLTFSAKPQHIPHLTKSHLAVCGLNRASVRSPE